MTEPTITMSAPVVEPWMTAVAAVMRQFVIYAQERMLDGDLEVCRRLAGVSPATAALFEDSLDAISEDVDDAPEDSAAPGRPGPGAADNTSE